MTQFEELAAPTQVRHDRSGAVAVGAVTRSELAPGPAAILALQRSAGNAAVVAQLAEDEGQTPGARPITDVVSGGGAPLDQSTKGSMERAFGHDFGDVRIHDDATASAAAQDVSAKAATVGSHIVFRSGEFDPGSAPGQHLLAHELTHVVQQRSGPVDGTSAGGGVKVSDPSDRFEVAAEANADRISEQLSASSVQREEEDESETEE